MLSSLLSRMLRAVYPADYSRDLEANLAAGAREIRAGIPRTLWLFWQAASLILWGTRDLMVAHVPGAFSAYQLGVQATLRRHPGRILVVAIVIGVPCAIAGVTSGLRFGQIRVPSAGTGPDVRIGFIAGETNRSASGASPLSLPELRRLEGDAALGPIVALNPGVMATLRIPADGSEYAATLGLADAGLFSLLQLHTQHGRAPGLAPSSGPESVISHDAWKRWFLSDPEAVGSRIVVSGVETTLVGVLDPSASGRSPGPPPDVWMTIEDGGPAALPTGALANPRTRLFLGVIAVDEKRSARDIRARLSAVAQQWRSETPADHEGRSLRFSDVGGLALGSLTPVANLLFGSALLVVVVGSWYSARVPSGAPFATLRLLGAPRFHIFMDRAGRCTPGVLGALGFAFLLTLALRTGVESALANLGSMGTPSFAATVLPWAAVALIPFLASTGGERSGRRPIRRSPRISVVGMNGVAVLIAGLALFWAMSAVESYRQPFGISVAELRTAGLVLSGSRADQGEAIAALASDLDSAPSIADVSILALHPVTFGSWTINVTRTDDPARTMGGALPPRRIAGRMAISEGGLARLGIEILSGREFSPADAGNRATVAIISESLSRAVWPDGDALGSSFFPGLDRTNPIRVVGIAADVRSRGRFSPTADLLGDVYVPLLQTSTPEIWIHYRPAVGGSAGEADSTLLAIAAAVPSVEGVSAPGRLSDLVASRERPVLGSIWLLTAAALLLWVLVLLVLGAGVALQVEESRPSLAIRRALGGSIFRAANDEVRPVIRATIMGAALGAIGLAGVGRSGSNVEVFSSGLGPTSAAIFGAIFAVSAAIIIQWTALSRIARVAVMPSLEEGGPNRV